MTTGLFSIEPPANAARGYVNLYGAATEEHRNIRAHCERLWELFSAYADKNFLTEFVLHFHERWFEMYLGAYLIERGITLHNTAPPGPDLLAEVDSRRVWIEAICPTAGEPGRPDTVEFGDGYVPWDRIALRIRGAVDEKKRKYDGYLERGIVSADNRLLIAVNVSAIPYARDDAGRYVFRAPYGVGELIITYDLKTLRPVEHSHRQLASIEKLKSGQPVGVQPFIDGCMPAIAGAIVSCDVSASAALLDSPPALTMYPNLTASEPWRTGVLPIPYEWQFEPTAEGWRGQLLLIEEQTQRGEP
jgi:hypothetical protein